MYQYEDEIEEEVFEFLDELRVQGDTNMFGARPYILEEFSIDKYAAKALLTKWIQTFSERHPLNPKES